VIADFETDTVFVSDLLSARYPQIECELRSALSNRLRVIPRTKDIWCRDFMPIQLNTDRFVQFRYEPDYLKDSPHMRTRNGASLLNLSNCAHSNLVIDGGNIVRQRNAAIMTDKIYRENPSVERPRLRDRLRILLEVDPPIVIPKERYDRIGHADGMVRFVDEKTVLVNDYRKLDRSFGKRIAKALTGFELVPFPYCPTHIVTDGIASAVGVYINFLQIAGTIFLPIFGLRQDERALKLLGEAFPSCRIISIRSNELAIVGGVLNCVTWNVKTRPI
jgi:agmatine deiminase